MNHVDDRAMESADKPSTAVIDNLHRPAEFSDPAFEASYQQVEFTEHKRIIGVNLAMAGAANFGFLLLDPWLLPAHLVEPFRWARLLFLFPMIAIAVFCLWRARSAYRWILSGSIAVFVFGLAWPALLYLGRDEAFAYLSLALIQTTVGTFFLMGFPVKWALLIAYAHTFIFIAASVAFTSDWATIFVFGVGFITVNLFAGFGARRYDGASRRRYVAQTVSDAEHASRLLSEASRNRWLSVIAAFLRHELKNAMTGVSTSLDLATRHNVDSRTAELLGRASRSVEFMRRLLVQAAEATSLETALTSQEMDPVNLSDLLSARLDEFAMEAPDKTFTASISSGVWVNGNADRLVQMLDKLLNNAVEHSRGDYPIHIELHADADHVALSIVNRGDALPIAVDIFEPFVSRNKAVSDASGLGLGLFVAKTIVLSHCGAIEAIATDAPTGAKFVVTLPTLARLTRNELHPTNDSLVLVR